MSEESTPDPHKRIEELEAQVSQLSVLVQDLVAQERHKKKWFRRKKKDLDSSNGPGDKASIVEGVREGVGRALGGEEGESLESRVGGIWLSRISAVLVMTAFALGGALALTDANLEPVHKVAIGYFMAALAVAYGFARWRTEDLFPQTILGSGLAALYFTTYAAFFLDQARLFDSQAFALPALALCLAFLAIVVHYRRSQTAAGIALFLIYYTVVLSLTNTQNVDNVIYALITCSLVSAVALLFHVSHGWLIFTWAALIATHLTYIFFFLVKPPNLDMSDEMYFWASNGFLTLSFILFSMAAVTDARKTGEFRKTVAPMAGVNSITFFVLTWISIRNNYVEFEWVFRLGFAGLLGIFAVYAELSGPRRNYLFQIYLAKAVLMFTLALQAYLSHQWLLVAMAVESLGLAFSYKRSGMPIFKILGLGLLGATFVGCILAVRIPGHVDLFGWTVPARWFSCIAAPLVFAIVAWFFEHFVQSTPPGDRIARGQWFLADTFLDIRTSTIALLYASAAAFVVLAITIIDLGNQPQLPYILAVEALAIAALGFLLRTPQVEVASVLLLIAAHVCYHLALFLEMPGFETQPNYIAYTALVALFTLFGGYLWERYLKRIKGGWHWEHDALSALPYIAGALMITTLAQRELDPLFAPVVQNLLGVLLMLAGAATVLAGLGIAGLLAIAIGTSNFYVGLYNFQLPLSRESDFFLALCCTLATYVCAERLIFLWGKRGHRMPTTAQLFRTLLILVMALLGAMGIWEWAQDQYLTLLLLALALAAMTAGVLFQEGRYRWAALGLYSLAIGRAYLFDLTNLSAIYRFLSFLGLCVPLLLISWVYSRIRTKSLRRLRAEEGDGSVTHEQS